MEKENRSSAITTANRDPFQITPYEKPKDTLLIILCKEKVTSPDGLPKEKARSLRSSQCFLTNPKLGARLHRMNSYDSVCNTSRLAETRRNYWQQ
jgi:hypothetical protein